MGQPSQNEYHFKSDKAPFIKEGYLYIAGRLNFELNKSAKH